MAEPQFDLIFRGDIVAGHSVQDVKARLAKLFKVHPARIEALFSGNPVALKRNLDRATAEKYQAVLRQAGAQVRLRPLQNAPQASVSRDRQPQQVQASHRAPVKGQRKAAATQSVAGNGPEFTLAPPGADLLKPSETRRVPEPQLDLSALSIRPAAGDLLDESEKPEHAKLELDLSGYQIAEAGADLLEGYRGEDLPLMEPDADFDLAEPGADLLNEDERQARQSVQVNTEHLKVLPLEK